MSTDQHTRIYRHGNTPIPAVTLNTAVPAGFPSPAGDYMEEEIDLVKTLRLDAPSVYIIRIEGTSMEGAFVPDRSYIVVDRARPVRSHQIVVAVLNGEFTVKRLIKTASGWMLQPENAMFSPYVIKDDDQFEVWGVVAQILIDPNLYI